MSKARRIIETAYARGYRVTKNGVLVSSSGYKPKLMIGSNGYLYHTISIRKEKNRSCKFHIHRYVAYCKYKEVIFDKGLQVRHLNGNLKDNSWDNIRIGTCSENMMDKSPEVRKQSALNAAKKLRKLTDAEVRDIRFFSNSCTYSYQQLAERYKVSKSTIAYIVQRKTYCTVV